MWAIEFGEPERGSMSWRVIERMQPGLFAQLVVAPLFSEHRILSQVAGHKHRGDQGAAAARRHRRGPRLLRRRARGDDQGAQRMPRVAHPVRADRRRYPLQLAAARRGRRGRDAVRRPGLAVATTAPRGRGRRRVLGLDLDHDLAQRASTSPPNSCRSSATIANESTMSCSACARSSISAASRFARRRRRSSRARRAKARRVAHAECERRLA